jgi:hypothetical protein
MARYTHRLPFDAKELLFMAALSEVILKDDTLFETFSRTAEFDAATLVSFRERLGSFVERAEERQRKHEADTAYVLQA